MGLGDKIKTMMKNMKEEAQAKREENFRQMPTKIEQLKMEIELEKLKKQKAEVMSQGTNASGGFGLGRLINEDALKNKPGTFDTFGGETLKKDSKITLEPRPQAKITMPKREKPNYPKMTSPSLVKNKKETKKK